VSSTHLRVTVTTMHEISINLTCRRRHNNNFSFVSCNLLNV